MGWLKTYPNFSCSREAGHQARAPPSGWLKPQPSEILVSDPGHDSLSTAWLKLSSKLSTFKEAGQFARVMGWSNLYPNSRFSTEAGHAIVSTGWLNPPNTIFFRDPGHVTVSIGWSNSPKRLSILKELGQFTAEMDWLKINPEVQIRQRRWVGDGMDRLIEARLKAKLFRGSQARRSRQESGAWGR